MRNEPDSITNKIDLQSSEIHIGSLSSSQLSPSELQMSLFLDFTI
jgi:hypothetical protein